MKGVATAPESPRSGKPIAVGLLVIILFAVSFAMYKFYATRAPQGDVLQVFAIDHRAVVFRVSENETFRVEMTLSDREEGPLWRKGVYALQFDTAQGTTVQDNWLTVRAKDVDDHLETHAFRLDTGEFKWRRRAFEIGPDGWQDGARSLAANGKVFEFYGGREAALLIYAVDRGELICRAELGDLRGKAPRFTRHGTTLVVDGTDALFEIDQACSITVHESEGCWLDGRWTSSNGVYPGTWVGCATSPTDRQVVLTQDKLCFTGQEPPCTHLHPTYSSLIRESGLLDFELPQFLPVLLANGNLGILDGASIATTYEVGNVVSIVRTERGTLLQVAPNLLLLVDGRNGELSALARVKRWEAAQHRVTIEALSEERVWVFHRADSRPLDLASLRQQRSRMALPSVTDITTEVSTRFPVISD